MMLSFGKQCLQSTLRLYLGQQNKMSVTIVQKDVNERNGKLFVCICLDIIYAFNTGFFGCS